MRPKYQDFLNSPDDSNMYLSLGMYYFAWAVIIKYRGLGDSINTNIFSHSSGCLEVQDQSVGRMGIF